MIVDILCLVFNPLKMALKNRLFHGVFRGLEQQKTPPGVPVAFFQNKKNGHGLASAVTVEITLYL